MTLREHVKKIKFILKGVATYLPAPIATLLPEHQHQFKGLGQRTFSDKTDIARAYYSVWMRMLVTMHEKGVLDMHTIKTVGEIGPGDSLTAGLSAILSGANTYVALDIVPTAHNYDNLELFEELVSLFKNKASIPDEVEQPKQQPHLSSYAFPSHIISDTDLERLLAPERLQNIRAAIRSFVKNEIDPHNEIQILLITPWHDEAQITKHAESIDLIFSNAAMEHVDDVPRTYESAAKLLSKGGLLSSAIDYKSHDTAGLWNGHWTYSPLMWRLVSGKTTYLINRWSHAMHLRELQKFFDIVVDIPLSRKNVLVESDIASPYNKSPFAEFGVSEGYIVGKKR
jgi:SAM-dependent methyltransferase